MTTCSTNACGLGGFGGPLPGDPDNNSILSATPAFGGIDVSWTYPTTNPEAVAHTILYRGVLPDFNTAIVIATMGGNIFYDKSTSEQVVQQYYWIRIVSVNGTVGELIGPASAVARPTIEVVLEQLAGRIDAGTLAQSLKTEIDRITLNAQAITQESSARVSANNAYSVLMTQVQAEVDGAYSVLNQEITARQAGDSSLVSQINTAQSVLGNSIATAQTTLQTNIDTVDGKANAIGALYTAKVNVNGLIGGFGVYNNGSEVQAGFDVDTFWVGRTNSDKVKPFIIQDDQVFIDQAVINELTFSKLRDESGNLVVADGKVKAQYLKVSTASIDNAAITAAKIQDAEVGTLKIAGNAISAPLSGSFTKVADGTWTNINFSDFGINHNDAIFSNSKTLAIVSVNFTNDYGFGIINQYIDCELIKGTTTKLFKGRDFQRYVACGPYVGYTRSAGGTITMTGLLDSCAEKLRINASVSVQSGISITVTATVTWSIFLVKR